MLYWLDTLIGLVVILLAVSLVIMVLTQIVVALLNLRGYNLKKGIQTLLENTGVDLEKYSEEITNAVLNHPLISDKKSWILWWKNATAIRKKEFLDILEIISLTGDEVWKIKIRDNLNDIKEKIENWFDSVMDRATQIFIRHTRISTVIFSIIVAFALHLDMFSLFHQVSTDAELRASLVASSDAVLKKADEVIGQYSVVPAVYSESILQLKLQDTTGIADQLEDPPVFSSREDAVNWIRQQLEVEAHSDSMIKLYGAIVDSNLTNYVEKMKDQAFSIKNELGKTKLQLIPEPYHIFDYSLGSKHFWGVLIMAAFLSLGAPFWFKALKTLSALRPVLASKEDKERKNREEGDTSDNI